MRPVLSSIAIYTVLASTASSACISEVELLTDAAPIVLLVDARTGQTLHQNNVDHRFVPASVTKVMSAFVAFEMIKAGEITENQTFIMSESAGDDWYRTGSTMFLEPGEQVSVDLLLKGITSVSANDASVVLAEGAAGSLEQWTARMNEAARNLGMTQSYFATPNGWPDDGKTFTTANDLAKLGGALIARHPELYARYFGKEGLRHNGFAQANHDPISRVVKGADGIKTGFTSQAGHGFLGSAERDDTRLVMVVAAVETEAQRTKIARDFINWGFDAFDRREMFAEGQSIGVAAVQNGVTGDVGLTAPGPITVAVPKDQSSNMSLSIHYNGPLQAPIKRGETVAHIHLIIDGTTTAKFPLVAAEDVGQAGMFQRIANALRKWFG